MRRLSSFRYFPHFPFRSGWVQANCLPLIFLSVTALNASGADNASASSISRQVKDIFEHAAKAVVKIHAMDPHGELCGTGFFVDPTWTIYTAYSVGGEAENF